MFGKILVKEKHLKTRYVPTFWASGVWNSFLFPREFVQTVLILRYSWDKYAHFGGTIKFTQMQEILRKIPPVRQYVQVYGYLCIPLIPVPRYICTQYLFLSVSANTQVGYKQVAKCSITYYLNSGLSLEPFTYPKTSLGTKGTPHLMKLKHADSRTCTGVPRRERKSW